MGNLRFDGILPAIVTPFTDDYKVDEDTLVSFAEILVKARGVVGVVCNGDVGEGRLLTREEKKRVTEVLVNSIGNKVPVVACIFAQSINEAIEQTKNAKDAGASGVLVAPLPLAGFNQVPKGPLSYFNAISKAVDMPMIIFQFPEFTGLSYPPEILAKLAEVKNVVAVKDAVWDAKKYEDDYRAIRSLEKKVYIVTACDTLLYTTFLLGADGALIGFANLVPELWWEMVGKYFEDVQVGERIITPGRTVTEADLTLFAGLTGDYNPIHTDEEFAKKHSIFKTRVVHGLFILSLCEGLYFRTGILDGIPGASLGWSNVKFTAPTMPGDTIHIEIEVLSKRESKSRPNFGIITKKYVAKKQTGEVVMEGEHILLMKMRKQPHQKEE